MDKAKLSLMHLLLSYLYLLCSTPRTLQLIPHIWHGFVPPEDLGREMNFGKALKEADRPGYRFDIVQEFSARLFRMKSALDIIVKSDGIHGAHLCERSQRQARITRITRRPLMLCDLFAKSPRNI